MDQAISLSRSQGIKALLQPAVSTCQTGARALTAMAISILKGWRALD